MRPERPERPKEGAPRLYLVAVALDDLWTMLDAQSIAGRPSAPSRAAAVGEPPAPPTWTPSLKQSAAVLLPSRRTSRGGNIASRQRDPGRRRWPRCAAEPRSRAPTCRSPFSMCPPSSPPGAPPAAGPRAGARRGGSAATWTPRAAAAARGGSPPTWTPRPMTPSRCSRAKGALKFVDRSVHAFGPHATR